MPYRMTDDSVTVRGKGHPEYSGKSVTPRGEEQRVRQGAEPGRYDVGTARPSRKGSGQVDCARRDERRVIPSAEDAESAGKRCPILRPSRRTIMATSTTTEQKSASDAGRLVEMVWDPITRIVGSLGLYTRIDFEKKEVAECFSTSSIFRGYSIFMKGKDPRDAHFITSRICGICGDNHATCSCYAQQMAYGVTPAGARRVDRQPRRSRRVHVRPQHLPGEPRRRRLLRKDGQGDQPRRLGESAEGRGAARRRITATGRSATSCTRSIRSRGSSIAKRS